MSYLLDGIKKMSTKIGVFSAKGTTRLFLAVCMVSFVFGCGGTHVDDDEQVTVENAIKIGLICPLTGSLASLGLTFEYSALLAVQEINAAGGFNGRPIELLVRDTQVRGDVGPRVAHELIDEGVVGIVGAIASSVTIPTSEQTAVPANVPMISPASTSPDITNVQDNDTLWRTIASDAFQGVILANELIEANLMTLSIINRDGPYGNGLANALTDAYVAQGGQVLARATYPTSKESGFSGEVAQLFANGSPEALVLISFLPDSASITRELQNFSPSPMPQLFGVDANFVDGLLTNGSPAVLLGMRGTAPVPPESAPNLLTFQSNFYAATGFTPDTYGDGTYDAVYLMYYAMLKANAATSEAIIANLRSVSRSDAESDVEVNVNEIDVAKAAFKGGLDINYNGASGLIDYDANGDITTGNYVIWEIVSNGGALEYTELKSVSFP